MSKVHYNSGDGIVEVIIRSDSGAKIEHLKSNLNSKDRITKIATRLFLKYDLDFSPNLESKDDFFDF